MINLGISLSIEIRLALPENVKIMIFDRTVLIGHILAHKDEGILRKISGRMHCPKKKNTSRIRYKHRHEGTWPKTGFRIVYAAGSMFLVTHEASGNRA